MHKAHLNADLISGLLFLAFGLWFFLSSIFGLRLGTAFRMGPGFFPAVLGGMLAVLGVLVAINGLRTKEGSVDLSAVPWRAVVLLPVGLIFFGAAMRPLGLIIALLGLCFCSSLAIESMTVPRTVALTVAITALCIGIFSFALGLSLPLVGGWLR